MGLSGVTIETSLVVGVGSGFAVTTLSSGIVLGSGFNATNAIVAGLNAYGYGVTSQSYLRYKATGSKADRNQFVSDTVVAVVSLYGTKQEEEALNILTATLTALGVINIDKAKQEAVRK
jgi:hypothetical protein